MDAEEERVAELAWQMDAEEERVAELAWPLLRARRQTTPDAPGTLG